MNAITWHRLQEILEGAAELCPAERDRFLDEACREDAALRKQAVSMLAAFTDNGSMLERAIDEVAAEASLAAAGLVAGDRLGPYRITKTIGKGGMGTVYRGERCDDQFRQSVAIKVVSGGFGTTSDLFLRFRMERQILASINHPHIARLLDGGISPAGSPYLVMEFIEGVSLERYGAERELSTAERLELFLKICSAVQYAHQNLIVHRDLKPTNVIVTSDGTPKLLDFGIAKLLAPELSGYTVAYTRSVERLMTPEYASPEQIRGETITTATDVYGLGVLLYEFLTGARPFRLARLTPAEIEKLICQTAPVPPSMVPVEGNQRASSRRISSDLDKIILKALHKEPARRYASVADFAADIERYLAGFPVSARPDSFGYRANRFVRRNVLAVSAAVVVFAALAGLGILLALQTVHARREAASASAVSDYLVGLFEFTSPDATQGRSVSARELLDRGTGNLHTNWKGEPVVKARLLSTLGAIYDQLGALDKAAPLLTEAEGIYTRQRGIDDNGFAAAANSLGTVFLDRGDLQRAAEQYWMAMRIYEKRQGRRSAEVAEILISLSAVESDQGNRERAEQHLLEAVAIHTAVSGAEADATLRAKHNLASAYTSEGNYRAAEPLLRDVLAIHRRTVGETQIVTASDIGNLAYLLDKLGRLNESEELSQRTLAINEKLFGPEHPRTATPLMVLGWVYRETGRLAAAEKVTARSVAMARKLEGEDSLHTAYDEDALGLVYLAAGNPGKAREWIELALRTRLGKSKPSPPLLSQSYDHLGLVDLAEGKLVSAREQIERGLAIGRRCYRRENDWIAIGFNHLGRVNLAEGDSAGSVNAFAAALRIARSNFGDAPHPITAESLYGLGVAALAARNGAAARPALEQSVSMRQLLYAHNHPDLLAARSALEKAKRT